MTRSEDQMDALQRISTGIELLESGYTVEWEPSREIEPGVHTMSYPRYDSRLTEALWGASELVGTDYGYIDRVDEVRELSIPEMSQSQLSTFLTWVQRGERFCDGFIAEFVKEGSVLQALRRASELERGVGLGVDRARGRGASGREQEDQRGRAVTPETTTAARIRVSRRASRWRFWDWDKRTVFETRTGDAPTETVTGTELVARWEGTVWERDAHACIQTALHLSLSGDRSSWVRCPSGEILADPDATDTVRPTGQAAIDARRARLTVQDRVIVPLLGFGAAVIMLVVGGAFTWSRGGTAGLAAYCLTALAAAAVGSVTLAAASLGPKWAMQLAFWAVPVALPVVISLDGYALGWLFGHLLGLALAAALLTRARRARQAHDEAAQR
ncbi:DUF6508 domain-containing protein [Leucobacter chromiireducens]|nr:DUF6508 domain-containing protein [Leucobacter chromiireducens]